MKKYIFILFTTFCICTMTAQNDKSIPGHQTTKKEITEQDYLEALTFFDSDVDQPSEELQKAMQTAQMYLMKTKNNQGMVELFEKAANYAKKTDQIKEFIDLKSNKAQMMISIGQYQNAIDLIDSLIANHEIRPDLVARFYKAKGDAYAEMKNLEESEKNYFKGLSIAQTEKDTFTIGICYVSLATIHSKIGNIYDAIDYNIKGLNILEKGDHAYLVTGASNVLCSIFQELGNYEKAQEYAEKMDQLCTMNNYKQLGAFAKAALGRQAKHNKDYNKAIEYYNLAIVEMDRKGVRVHASGDKKAAFRVKTDLAKTYFDKKDYLNAKAILLKIKDADFNEFSDMMKLNFYEIQLKLAANDQNSYKVRQYLDLSKTIITDDSSFEEQRKYSWINKLAADYFKDYKNANVHLSTYYTLKDSIEKKHKSQLIHNLEAKYQKAEQEKEISELSFENEKAESQIKRKNIVLTLGAIGLAILSFLVYQFYKLYQSNKRNKEQLASQNIIVTKALDDKNTLLKEIHHRVKNNLQVISSLLSLQSRYIKDEETLDAINAGKSRVQSMSLLHQNLYRDDNLKGVEMNQYFQNLGQNLFDTYNIEENISFTTDIDDITLDIDTVVPMGLITNELISNALKHAFKGKESGIIHLSLKEKGSTLFLTVKDNGVGLPDGELPVSYKSLGATLIQSFAEKLEGTIKIDSSEGSSITVEINDYTKIEQIKI